MSHVQLNYAYICWRNILVVDVDMTINNNVDPKRVYFKIRILYSYVGGHQIKS
jgi:hypothetical protein